MVWICFFYQPWSLILVSQWMGMGKFYSLGSRTLTWCWMCQPCMLILSDTGVPMFLLKAAAGREQKERWKGGYTCWCSWSVSCPQCQALSCGDKSRVMCPLLLGPNNTSCPGQGCKNSISSFGFPSTQVFTEIRVSGI